MSNDERKKDRDGTEEEKETSLHQQYGPLPGFGQPGMGFPGFGQPGMGFPGFGQPGMGFPGFGQPDMGFPGFGQPDMGFPGFGQPDMGFPGFGQPDMGFPGFGQPDMGFPGFGQPDMGFPGFGQPDMGFPGFGQPDMGYPGYGQPGTGYPGYPPEEGMVPRRPQQPPRMGQQSRFRVLHAIPDAPAVDVYVDGRRVASNLSFGRYTDYLPTTPGRHRVELTRAGTRNPILTQTIAVPMRDYLTIAAIDSARGPRVEPELAIYEDDPRTPPQKSRVRFIHLSPDAPAVDVFAARGRAAYQPLFRNVSYRTSTDYRTLNPGQYNLAVRAAGTNNTLLTVPNINLQANRAYTIAAIGKAEGQPRLRGLIMPH